MADSLKKILESRVIDFIQDCHIWRVFVADNFEEHSDQKVAADISKKYRDLIDTYCSAQKSHQGLVLSNNPDHLPEEEHILGFDQNGDVAIVRTEVRKSDGWIQPHDFEFKRVGEDWILDEVYYTYNVEDAPRYPCL